MPFTHPLIDRYASKEMVEIFSEENIYKTWRDLWIALAEAEKELGLPITEEQIEELKKYRDVLNIEEAKRIEREETQHDVMAHIKAYGLLAQKAKGIIHLGATSAYVTDNTDLILMKQALKLIRKRIISVIESLMSFAERYKNLVVPAYTHLQPAQPVTLGKRAVSWLYDLFLDLQEVDKLIKGMKARSIKGTTGSFYSFMELFEGDFEKVEKLEKLVAKKIGFEDTFPVTNQTYTRKVDFMILCVLANIGGSASKFANDIRYLQSVGEVYEPFGTKQVGSSAMPYKKNPILSERINSLARYLGVLHIVALQNQQTQFLERTLDDSANRRIVIPEAFMTADAILLLYKKIVDGLKVDEEMIKTRLETFLPFFLSEKVIMEAVKEGADRQEVHEFIRTKTMEIYEKIRMGEKVEFFDILEKEGNEVIKSVVKRLKQDKINLAGASEKVVERVLAIVQDYIKKENIS